VASRFVHHQSGVDILSLDGISSFAPARVQEVMAFSLATRTGETHLLCVGAEITCRLVVVE